MIEYRIHRGVISALRLRRALESYNSAIADFGAGVARMLIRATRKRECVLTSAEAKSPWSGAETDIIEGGGN